MWNEKRVVKHKIMKEFRYYLRFSLGSMSTEAVVMVCLLTFCVMLGAGAVYVANFGPPPLPPPSQFK